MNSNINIRKWLDRYQSKLIPILGDFGYGCLYVDDISIACGITSCRAIKYSSDVGILFNEEYFDVVSDKIACCIKDVLEKHPETKTSNKICFTVLHGGSVLGGFGIWVVRETSEYIDNILNSDKPYLIGFL